MFSGNLPTLSDGKLPVFAFPHNLTFYTDDKSSYKQVVTIYNPYDSALKFKVQCTSPQKYSVIDPEGVIKPRCCVDIVIRHTDIRHSNEGEIDKFRIQMQERGQKAILGKKDIPSVLFATKDHSPTSHEDKFQSLPPIPGHRPESQQSVPIRSVPSEASGPSLVIVFTAIFCVCVLMLPTTGDKDTRLPDYLVLSVNQKLIAAYVLGLVTMVLLKT